MCVIAGYIGNQPAAPILLEMLRREEGLFAGYYSGIATVHEGRLYYEKVIGSAADLARKTDASSLPGNIGIVHGRTQSGGDVEWGHPFVDGAEQLAYIANGSSGQYVDNRAMLSEAGDALLAKGHCFRSAQKEEKLVKYPTLSDGRSVHASDVMAQAIAEAFRGREPGPGRLLDAACEVYEAYPGEIVGLCLHASHPDEIVAARHNKPLVIGRDQEGALFLASSPTAFPVAIAWRMRMPSASGAVFRRDGSIRIVPFPTSGLIPMGRFPSASAIDAHLGNLLRSKGSLSVAELLETGRAFWPPGVLGEREIVVFEWLDALLSEGKVSLVDRDLPGVCGSGTAPQTWVEWTDAGRAA